MIRWLLVFVAVLMLPSSASAIYTDGTCAGWGDVTCFQQDRGSLTTEQKATIAAQYTYMNGRASTITGTYGMGYSSLPFAYRTAFWDRMIEAEENSGVLDVTTPADILQGIRQEVLFTDVEAQQSFAAKIAHTMWVEVNSKMPWSLDDFTDAEIQYLFKPASMFETWDTGSSTEAARQYYFVDHSPSRTWTVAVDAVGGLPYTGTGFEAWLGLLENVGSLFHHGTSTQYPETIDQALVTLATSNGCHAASRIMAAVARALNIPAYNDAQWLLGEGHASAFFPVIDVVLLHGDDMYAAGNWWPLELTHESYAWVVANLTKADTSNAAKTDRRRAIQHSNPWTNGFYDSYFCAQGWDYLEGLYEVNLTQDQHWLDAWKQEFINRTGGDGDPGTCP